MTLVWKHVRPSDHFLVELAEPIFSFHLKMLAQLYQPLIGVHASALYTTLFSEVEGDKLVSSEKNHQWLMQVMDCGLDSIYVGRLRLEALGLLRTYKTSLGSIKVEDTAGAGEPSRQDQAYLFRYCVQPPLDVHLFFEDDILSISLYNRLGPVRFKQLRARYAAHYAGEEQGESSAHEEDVTREFHEVFRSIQPTELTVQQGSQLHKDLTEARQESPFPDKAGTDPGAAFERYKLDIEVLKGFMMKGLDSHELLTPDRLREMKKIAYFYQLDEYQLSRLIQDSLTLDDELDAERLKEKAKEWYRLQHRGKPPQLTAREIHTYVQPVHKREYHTEKVQTDEERHFAKLESISPMELLQAYQSGGKVAEADIRLVEELAFDYQLEPSVVNLLIEYILFTNDFKLPRNLVTKVAAHWKRLNIKSIKEAQELAKKEHQQYKSWKQKPRGDQESPQAASVGVENGKQQHRNSKTQVAQAGGTGQANGTPSSGSRRRAAGGYSKGKSNQTKQARKQAQHVRQDTLPEWIAEPRIQLETKKRTPSLSVQEKRERMKALLKALGEDKEDGHLDHER